MIEQIAALHTKLEAAMPFLMPPGWLPPAAPLSSPYVPAAINIHVHSCWICLQSGLSAGMTRDSVAVRVTTAILNRLGYNATPVKIELFL